MSDACSEPRILVVDDRRANLLAMEQILREMGHGVALAESGPEALRLLMKTDFSAILLDITMPIMDGFEVATLIRNRERSAHTPILFVTGHNATEDFVRRGYSLGAVDYIFTPVVPSILRAKITVFVELDRKRRQLEAHGKELARLNEDLERRVATRTGELRVANAELTALTHSISHDLRAPLRHITMLAELLRESSPELRASPAYEHLEKLTRAAEGMNALFEGLLAFFRSGRTSLTLSELDSNAIVREVIDCSAPRASGVEWVISDLPHAYGDAVMVRQVWTNLIDNAIKYSSRSLHPRIEIGIGGSSDPAEHTFFVRDNGAGFESSQTPRLFNVFQRLHPREEFNGAGVGLAIVDRIVRRHGGCVWAEGAVGRGAVFYFSLPAVENPAAVVTERVTSCENDQNIPISAAVSPPLSILLVDDDDDDAAMMERSLRERRWRGPLVRARDGLEALARLRAQFGTTIEPPFLIVADIEMPKMDGLAFLRQLREDPEHRGSVVFIHAAAISEERRREAYAAHAAAVVDKLRSGDGFRNFARMLAFYVDCVEAPL